MRCNFGRVCSLPIVTQPLWTPSDPATVQCNFGRVCSLPIVSQPLWTPSDPATVQCNFGRVCSLPIVSQPLWTPSDPATVQCNFGRVCSLPIVSQPLWTPGGRTDHVALRPQKRGGLFGTGAWGEGDERVQARPRIPPEKDRRDRGPPPELRKC